MSTVREQILRGGFGGVIKLANILLLFLISTALARTCGAYSFGVYSYVFAIIQILSILAQLGYQVLAVREVAAYRTTGSWGLLKGFIRHANLLVVGVSGALIATCLLALWILSERLSDLQLRTFLWGLVLFPLVSMGNLRGSILRGLHRIVAGQLPELVLRPGMFLLLLVGVWWSRGSEAVSPELAMALHAAAALVAFLWGAEMLRRRLPPELRTVRRQYQTGRWVRSALLLSLMSSMQIVNSQTDIVMLGAMSGPTEAGIYRVAVQCGLLVIFGMAVFNMVAAPYFGSYFAQNDLRRIQSLATMCARVATASAVPVVLVIHFWGEWILDFVFGTEFLAGYSALRILAAGQLFSTAMGTVVVLLSMTGHESSLVKGLVITAGLNILLNLVLIPRWGMAGAATATAVSMLFWNLALARAVKSKLGVSSWVFGLGGRR